jgi:hypothetical protein
MDRAQPEKDAVNRTANANEVPCTCIFPPAPTSRRYVAAIVEFVAWIKPRREEKRRQSVTAR